VPAYQDFLAANGVHHKKIATIGDFVRYVPITDKKNYIKQYPVADRLWKGDLTTSDMVAMSSGTSGEPVYWPRRVDQELEAAVIHELIYRYLFKVDKRKTLAVISFPMGVYVSGMATVLPTWLCTIKNYPITFVSPGNNRAEVLRVIQNFGSQYDQVLLIGHPFFVKDVLETGNRENINWKALNLKMMYCSEGFSELWRSYVMSQAGLQYNFTDAINTYGSSEMLLLGHEMPLTIFARQIFESDPEGSERFFGSANLPQLFQYNPQLRYIETVNDELIFTVNSGVPLIRFNLHDSGQVIGFDQLAEELDGRRPGWRAELEKKSGGAPLWKLPIVTLRGRSDQTIIFYAANIYPEHIHHALSKQSFFSKLTGRFTVEKSYLNNMDQYLEINLEMQIGVKPTPALTKKVKKQITETLLEINHEYLDTVTHHPGKDLSPRIKLWPYQHEKYFKAGLKPKYILQK
jgi:phenylacetate-CoA ligase